MTLEVYGRTREFTAQIPPPGDDVELVFIRMWAELNACIEAITMRAHGMADREIERLRPARELTPAGRVRVKQAEEALLAQGRAARASKSPPASQVKGKKRQARKAKPGGR